MNTNLIDLLNDVTVDSGLSGDESFDDMMAHYESRQIEPIKDKIIRMEDYLLTLPQAEIPVNHYINNGIYYREITIPQGVFCTGSIYAESHIHFVIRGDMTVLTEEGLKRVTGPCTFVSAPNVKRAGYAHEETVWAAVFRTDETDPDKAFEAIEKRAR
jgi:hypothetical protein